MGTFAKFRNYFKKFSNENESISPTKKIRRYLLYAFGEIILIVLGILIALHFNKLSESEETKFTEIKILQEIKSNLKSTEDVFMDILKTEKRYLYYNKMILDYLDNKKPYSDSLDLAFGTYFWTISSNPITSGYAYLKSKGLGVIENDSLREKISYMFESDLKIIKNDNEIWANNLQLIISYPFQVKHFRKYFPLGIKPGDDQYAKPINYNFLVKDDKFKNINAEIIANRKWNIFSHQEIIGRIRVLIIEIDKELERLDIN